MAELPREFVTSKELLKESVQDLAVNKFEFDLRKAEYDALMDQVNGQVRSVKIVYDMAKDAYDQTEQARAAAFETFKSTEKSDPQYLQVKALLDQARTAKTQAENTKKQAHDQLNAARKPFAERIATSRSTKEEAYVAYSDAKDVFERVVETFQAICQKYFKDGEARAIFDEEMRKLAMEILSARRKIHSEEAWLDITLDIMRDFVSTNKIGFTSGDLATENGYPLWIDLAESVMVVLEANPRYTVPKNRLIDLIGQDAFLSLIDKVAHQTVEKAIKAGSLTNTKTGKPMTLEELEEITITDLQTPRVKINPLGLVRMADLEHLVSPEFLKTTLQDAEKQGNMPEGTAEELGKQGKYTINDILADGVGLVTTKVLGEKRANALFGMLEKLRR
ncbi:MAG: hypothetical protein WC663_04375 [Patescibacteria group bacterium]|jgi:hypothetical protein